MLSSIVSVMLSVSNGAAPRPPNSPGNLPRKRGAGTLLESKPRPDGGKSEDDSDLSDCDDDDDDRELDQATNEAFFTYISDYLSQCPHFAKPRSERDLLDDREFAFNFMQEY